MTADRQVKWAVIGAGGIAQRRTIPEGIIPAPNAKLVGVYSPRSGQAVAKQFGCIGYDSIEALLAGDCEAVYVASPNDQHAEQVIAAARAGKHVLCEKPLGLDVAEAKAMVQVCQQANVQLATGFMMRYHPAHQALQQVVTLGQLGKPVLARAQLSGWYPPIANAWRQDPKRGGGGVLMDLAGHCIDLLEMLLGPIENVSCRTGRLVHDYASEDTGLITLGFVSGAMGVVDTLFNVPDASSLNRLEIYGSRGSVLAEGTLGQQSTGQVVLRLAQDDQYDARQQRTHTTGRPLTFDRCNLYQAQIQAFSDAILGTDPTLAPADGRQGLRNQRILAACYESARTGCLVTLD